MNWLRRIWAYLCGGSDGVAEQIRRWREAIARDHEGTDENHE